MQKVLANVITDLTRVKFDIKVNKCKSMDEIDKSLPTLIIGYKNAKKYIKDFNEYVIYTDYNEMIIDITNNRKPTLS